MIKVSKSFVHRGCTDKPPGMDRTSMDIDDDASLVAPYTLEACVSE